MPKTKCNTNKEKYIRSRIKSVMHRFFKHHFYLISLALSVLIIFAFDMAAWSGNYIDSDGYMRALRLEHFIKNPIFWEQIIPESNYPFGEINHWTRPMDILWLICYLPFSFFFSLKDAVFLGGAFLSPWIEVATAMMLVYGLRRHFNIYITILMLFFFLNSHPSIFSAGRPDHHSLMIFWLVSAMSMILCWLKKRKNSYMTRLGIILALSVFTAIEGMFLYAFTLFFFIFLYIFKNFSLAPACHVAKSFALTLTACWLLNPPYQGWFYPDNGRISVLFVCLAWLGYGGFWIIENSHTHKRKLKILNLLCITSGIALVLTTIFGADIFSSPLTPEITVAWATHINEMQPITKINWDLQLYVHGLTFIALILSFYLLRLRAYRRLILLNLCFILPIFICALYALRFANYCLTGCLIPFACFIDYLYKKFPHRLSLKQNVPVYIWGILSIFTIQIICLLPYSINHQKEKPQKSFSAALCQNIHNIGGTLVTNTFLGPKYMWRCEVNVVATPYHRNIEGIMDNYHILSETDDAKIVPLLLKHQVTQIAVFGKYQKEFDKDNPNLLFNRLRNHQNVPDFLIEIPVDFDTAHHYRVKI